MSNLLVVINEDEDIYRTINLTGMLDNKLSWKAKGIHYYFRTRPKNWEINFNDLLNKSTDGHDSNRSGIKELIDMGYLYRLPIKDEKKQIKKWIYISFPKHMNLNEEEIQELLKGNPFKGNPYKVNPSYSNNNISNKNKERELKFPKEGATAPTFSPDSCEKNDASHKQALIPIPKESPYLNHWNSLDISHHKPEHNGQGNQTYIRATSILKSIEKGSFLSKRELSHDFMKKHNITRKQLSTPLVPKQIRETLSKLRFLFVEGYWGFNKFDKARNLSSLLYNPRSQASMFYAVMSNPALTAPDSERFAINDKHPEITEMFLPLFANGNDAKLSNRDTRTLVYGIGKLVKLHAEYKKVVSERREDVDPRGKFYSSFRTSHQFLEQYRDYLDNWSYELDIHVGMVSPGSWMWTEKFLEDLYQDMDLDLREDG